MVRLFFFEYKVKFWHFESAQSKIVNRNSSIVNNIVSLHKNYCDEEHFDIYGI